jgi:PTS system nitrogen regulatory IIA component
MNLKKVLTRDCILPELHAGTKHEVIEEMVAGLLFAGKIKDKESAIKAITTREAKMSTGMQNGIAIPHGRTNSVDQLVVAIGIHRDGVDFDAMDQKPCHIFIVTLSPENRTGPHIQFLAEISKLLSKPGLREKLIAAPCADDILKLLTE